MKKRITALIASVVFILLVVSGYKTFELIDRKLTESAYSNLSSSVAQVETSITANWLQDAENLYEIASLFSKAKDPTSIIKNIKPNDAVYRYLYVVDNPDEALATDGIKITNDDYSLIYTPINSFETIERSNAFLGNMGGIDISLQMSG